MTETNLQYWIRNANQIFITSTPPHPPNTKDGIVPSSPPLPPTRPSHPTKTTHYLVIDNPAHLWHFYLLNLYFTFLPT